MYAHSANRGGQRLHLDLKGCYFPQRSSMLGYRKLLGSASREPSGVLSDPADQAAPH